MPVVDQNGSIKSDNVKATYDGSEWTTSEVVNYSPTYQYYAYYPYTTSGLSNLGSSSSKGSLSSNAYNATDAVTGTQSADGARASTRAVSANTSASDFFATGISNFTPKADQSTAANFNASDLQVAKATISRVDASDVTFSMERQMNLVQLSSAGSQEIFVADDDTQTSTDGIPYTVSPYTSGSNHYAISKSPSGETASITKPYALALGDIYYSDGYVSHSSTHLDATESKTPIGFVGYIGQNYWTEYNTGSGHGGHALVMCLRNVGANGSPNNAGTGYCWDTRASSGSYIDAGRTKVTTMDSVINSYNQAYGSGYIESNALNFSYYSAIRQTLNYTTLPAPKTKSTGWFLPTIGQFYAIVYAHGFTVNEEKTNTLVYNTYNKNVTDSLTKRLVTAANGTGYTNLFIALYGKEIWFQTSTEISANRIYAFSLYTTNGWIDFLGCNKEWNDLERCRPFLAF